MIVLGGAIVSGARRVEAAMHGRLGCVPGATVNETTVPITRQVCVMSGPSRPAFTDAASRRII